MMSSKLSSLDKKIIFLSSLGGALEFYDFIIYVFFASEFSQLFFPNQNHFASMMSVYATFAIGYLIRPIGGMIFSHIGDKHGRKKTFVATLLLMALPTFLMGLLPTYQMIGSGATILLILLRVTQGLSVGGEIPGAVTFTGEHVTPARRGLACAIIFFGINLGLVLGSGISTLLSMFLSHQQVLSWGWRLPFIFGGLLGILSFHLRKQLTETPVFSEFQAKAQDMQSRFPIAKILSSHRIQLFQGVAFTCLDAVVVCLLFLYLPTYLTSILHYPKETINVINTLTLILNSMLLVIMGWLSDYFGRRIFLIIGSLSFVIFGYGFFYLLAQQHVVNVVIVMVMVAACSTCVTGIYTCAIIELFPTPVRYTGMALSYNIGFAFFGGLTPLIATGLINFTGNILSPSFYLIVCAVICLIGALTFKNRHRQVLI